MEIEPNLVSTPVSNEFSNNSLLQDSKASNFTPICRICLENTSEDKNALIAPCQCSGSVKYVHQECLKTWLVPQSEDFTATKCELCHFPYKIQVEVRTECTLRNAWRRLASNCLLIPLFIILLSMLIFILVLLGEKLKSIESQEGQVIIGVTIVLASVGAVFIVLIMVSSLKKAMTAESVETWTVLPYDEDLNSEQSILFETSRPLS